MPKFVDTPRKQYKWPLIIAAILLAVFLISAIFSGETISVSENFVINGQVFSDLSTGFFTSLIGSLTFLLFLYVLKPDLKISEHIAYNDDKDTYYIKVINKSYFFSCYDLKVRLYKMSPIGAHKGNNYLLNSIDINESEITFIDNQKDGQDNATYALSFAIDEDINDILSNDSNNVMFEISSKHSFSGFSKTYKRHYYHTSYIKYGMFVSGDTTEIK